MIDRLVVETNWGFTIKQAMACIDEMSGLAEDPNGILPGYRTYLLERQLKALAYRAQLQTMQLNFPDQDKA